MNVLMMSKKVGSLLGLCKTASELRPLKNDSQKCHCVFLPLSPLHLRALIDPWASLSLQVESQVE